MFLLLLFQFSTINNNSNRIGFVDCITVPLRGALLVSLADISLIELGLKKLTKVKPALSAQYFKMVFSNKYIITV